MSDMSDIGMSDDSLRLDGNAAAGVLEAIFRFEMTSAETTCAHCGRTSPLGGLMLYGGQVGTVLRCPGCDAVQLRIVSVPERGGHYYLDLRGMSVLRISASPTA